MIYDVIHLTRYHYGAPVAVNACVLRLAPRDEPGQKVASSKIEVFPRPQLCDDRLDIYGNRTTRIRIEQPKSRNSASFPFEVGFHWAWMKVVAVTQMPDTSADGTKEPMANLADV